MLPHIHAVIAVNVSLIFAFFYQLQIPVGFKWALVAGLAALLLDLDAVIAMLFSSDLRYYLNPMNMLKEYDLFRDALLDNVIFKVLAVSHIVISLAAIYVCYYEFRAFFVPLTIGVVSHLAGDVYTFFKGDIAEAF